MNRTAIISSRIISIGWERNDQPLNQPHSQGTLEVEFKGGSVYQYSPVSHVKYIQLLGSPSVGQDIQEIINDKSIVCTKISSGKTK